MGTKKGKATGVDEISAELIKCFNDDGLMEIVKLYNKEIVMYNTGEWCEEF